MARRRRYGGSTRRLRPVEWKSSIQQPSLASGNTVFGGQFIGDAVMDPFTAPTLMTIRGRLMIYKTTAGTASGVFGIIAQKKPTTAEPVGLSPVDDANASWIVWEPFFVRNTSADEDAMGRYHRIDVNAKSKRVLPGRTRLYYYYDSFEQSTEYSMAFALRSLIKE